MRRSKRLAAKKENFSETEGSSQEEIADHDVEALTSEDCSYFVDKTASQPASSDHEDNEDDDDEQGEGGDVDNVSSERLKNSREDEEKEEDFVTLSTESTKKSKK